MKRIRLLTYTFVPIELMEVLLRGSARDWEFCLDPLRAFNGTEIMNRKDFDRLSLDMLTMYKDPFTAEKEHVSIWLDEEHTKFGLPEDIVRILKNINICTVEALRKAWEEDDKKLQKYCHYVHRLEILKFLAIVDACLPV